MTEILKTEYEPHASPESLLIQFAYIIPSIQGTEPTITEKLPVESYYTEKGYPLFARKLGTMAGGGFITLPEEFHYLYKQFNKPDWPVRLADELSWVRGNVDNTWGFLSGIYGMSGSVNTKDELRIAAGSEDIAVTLLQLLQSVGIESGSIKRVIKKGKEVIGGVEVTQREDIKHFVAHTTIVQEEKRKDLARFRDINDVLARQIPPPPSEEKREPRHKAQRIEPIKKPRSTRVVKKSIEPREKKERIVKASRIPDVVRMDDTVRAYFHEIAQYPLLDREDEVRLAQQMEQAKAEMVRLTALYNRSPGEERPSVQHQLDYTRRLYSNARETFTNANLRLVVSWAIKYHRKSGVPLLDLIQEGNEGLLKAFNKYNWRKSKFSTYATWWIRQALGRFVNEDRLVTIPTNLWERRGAIFEVQNGLLKEGITPTYERIAAAVGESVETITVILNALRGYSSLDMPAYEDSDMTVGDTIPDINQGEAEMRERVGLKEAMGYAVGQLKNPRSQRVLVLRFGLEDGRSRTLEEIGTELRLSRERVRQLSDEAIELIKRDSVSMSMLEGYI